MAVLLGEAVPILLLVGVIALAGPADPDAASEFARRAGSWVGPVGGALTLLLVTWWAGRASRRPILQGALIGLAVALLDFGILVASGEPFQVLFIVSNVGKVLAGVVGGWLATRMAQWKQQTSQ